MMTSYVGRSEAERKEMLHAIGVGSMEDLLDPVPAALRAKARIELPGAMSELDVRRRLRELSLRNIDPDGVSCFAGAGVYDHFVPAAVRHLLSRSEFSTCYTPYQAEVSQGTLQAIFEFQSLMCAVTGMDVCNASMYDCATAVAEAALLAVSATGERRILVSACLNPHYVDVLKTYCTPTNIEMVEIPEDAGVTDLAELESALGLGAACFIHQQPNFFGVVEETSGIGRLLSSSKALLVSCVDPISLSLLEPPSTYGADIVVGEGQGLGNAMSFGGPLLGFFAARKDYVRKLPGRIVGLTSDVRGRRGFVLTLQTREQHIRREKATSNICTNQALVALAATVHVSLLGEEGMREVAEQCLSRSHFAAECLSQLKGFSLKYDRPFFKEFLLECPVSAEALVEALFDEGILGGVPLSRFSGRAELLLVAVTEKRTRKEIECFVDATRRASERLPRA
ncbi:MAG: aminomethyl-transferring glycine dehydrogenase subunit GcvPA [Candidatus Eiseniibacteriota bacterium]|nr:MAG: aminomethyl-transferring glycine dehydrogenase subunit GcvPA [Candidatus Eisenbacteria bacterium]